MKKNVFVLALFCIVSMMANAEVAKYCMSYDDFVAGNWKSVDELTAGRTQQVCQMKSGDHGVFYFKTGDKQSDELLKKDAFAVMYGQQLFVNCRNLRYKDVSLETSKYVQAVRYDKDKLCIMSYRTDGLTALANDTPLLERYKAVKAKHNRQSAANILPILMEKGLVESAAN